jgi:DNA-binding transcriptional LysR family regulator
MRSLNLDQLKALETVVELGSFTGAAQKLNLSQSAVSTQIRELEERFGLQLVERLGKKAFATDAGREVIRHGGLIAAEADNLSAAMRRRRDGWLGRVRLGASTTALIYHLPPLLERLTLAHPNLELVVTTGTTSGVAERILRNEIDAGIVSLPVDDPTFEVTPLCDEQLVAIFPASMKKLPKSATPRVLAEHRLILEYARANVKLLIANWFAAAGVETRSAMELDNLEAVKQMVTAGLGASIVPESAVRDGKAKADIVVRPLEPALIRTLAYIQRRDKPDEPGFRIVRDALMTLRRPSEHRPR